MSSSSNHSEDDEAMRALRTGLKADRLSPDALRRVRVAVEAEWRASTRIPRARRWPRIAAAASVLVLAAAGSLYYGLDPPPAGPPLGTIVKAQAPGVESRQLLGRRSPLHEGAALLAPQAVVARGDALIELASGGNLRVMHGTEFEVQASNIVKLEHGEIYVDIPPGAHASEHFVVTTPAGEFRHVGTQFALAVRADETLVRVREGRVQWLADDTEESIGAGTEIRIDSRRQVTRRSVPTSGSDWSWTEGLVPDIDIEGKPLSVFLDWVCRETGRKLVLADDEVSKEVARTRMHGNVRGMTPLAALRAVMAATALRFELTEGAIRLSLARDAPTTRS